MSIIAYRHGASCRRATTANLTAFAIVLAFLAGPAAAQQSAPQPETVTLPEIEVVTQANPKPKKPAAKQRPAVAKPKAAPAPAIPVAEAPAPTPDPAGSVNDGTPSGNVAPVLGGTGNPGAQTATGIDTKRLQSEPVFSANDLLRQAPGVSIKQGNGPRDVGISIRGSNARNGFGIRNIVVMEDGFPVTQPDGLSRSDLIDPRAYAGVDVWRGPSSALFGNYATGGALNFRTRRGGDINGIEYGVDVGSNGYLNNYTVGGVKLGGYEGAVFLSDVRGDGHYDYSSFETQTINALLTWQPTSDDKFTFKAINNEMDTELPFRMSLNQFRANPYQRDCATAATAAAGCVTNNFSATNTNPRVPQTAAEARAGRDDRRSIFGARWEHRFSADTEGRVQVVLDDRNISQPTSPTTSVGDYFSYNVMTDVSHRQIIAGLPSTQSLGAFWNHLPVDGDTYNMGLGGRVGTLQSNVTGSTTNFGARYRHEVVFAPAWSAIAGATVERTQLEGSQRSYTYNAAGAVLSTRFVEADRELTNVAPELGLLYRPSDAWQFRGRVGTGYGSPQFGNLFVTPDGVPGNNTELEAQTNVGYDLGFDWTPTRNVMLSVTGFYEFFENELVSQSAGPGLQSFTFNAPASEHRGIEVATNVTLAPGLRWSAAYLYNDQFYTEYSERLSGSAILFDRSGNKIPGVSPHELTTRLAYDHQSGAFKGVGGHVEYQWHDAAYMENANLLEAPAYDLVNLNVHYETEFARGPIRALTTFFEIRNVLDEVYVSSANNITNTATGTAANLANVSGSIYAGAPRTYYGGMRLKF